MNRKEKKGRTAADILILLGMLALLSVICRLWPILLLMILGIFVAALWVLCNRPEKVEVLTPVPLLPGPKPIYPRQCDRRGVYYFCENRTGND